ncbi:SSU ribosomal protein S3AE, partial [Enterocytozoon bieneusi H348]
VNKRRNPAFAQHYAKASEIKIIRKRIVETTLEHLDGIEVEKLVKVLSTEGLAKEFETRCNEIYPIFAMIIKVKPIKNMQCIIVKTRSDDPAHLESDNKSDLENE